MEHLSSRHGRVLQPQSLQRDHERLKTESETGAIWSSGPHRVPREIIERQEGYKRTRIVSRPVIDEKAAALVKRTFEQFDQGMGYESIVVSLNDEGYRTEQERRGDSQ